MNPDTTLQPCSPMGENYEIGSPTPANLEQKICLVNRQDRGKYTTPSRVGSQDPGSQLRDTRQFVEFRLKDLRDLLEESRKQCVRSEARTNNRAGRRKGRPASPGRHGIYSGCGR